MKTRRDDQQREAQRQHRRQLDLDREGRRGALLDNLEELLFDFQGHPEQIALYLADLEELGLLSPDDREALDWEVADRLGRDAANVALGRRSDQAARGAKALASLQAERDQALTPLGKSIDLDAEGPTDCSTA